MSVTNVRSFGGSVAIGTKDVQGKTLRVDGKVTTKKIIVSSLTVGDMTNPHIPIGAIMIWSGAVANIPNHWKLCNGTSYTRTDGGGTITAPDLRDMFVRGKATSGQPVGSISNHNHTMTDLDIPKHTHGITQQSVADHQHQYATYNTSNHVHNVENTGAHDHGGTNAAGSHNHNTVATAHNHGSNDTGGHSHNLDLVDIRNGRTGYVSGGINYNYNSSAGSWTRHSNAIRSYSSPSQKPGRTDAVGDHNHGNADASGQHQHGTVSLAGDHQHQGMSNSAHQHQYEQVTNNAHTHALGTDTNHDHQGFQISPGTPAGWRNTGVVASFSKLASYYVLAYVIKI